MAETIGSGVFQEALSHSRRKTLLRTVISRIHIEEYKNSTFQQIYTDLYTKHKQTGDIGKLTIYDLTSGLCKHHKIPIDKVFIIGKGPQRAVKILKLKTKQVEFNGIKLNYVDINEVNAVLDVSETKTTDGDSVESFLCKWQKTK